LITEQIFAWADRSPDKTAVVEGDRVLSYAQFAHRIAQAIACFSAIGLRGPGTGMVVAGSFAEFWIISLAARQLGLTTTHVQKDDDLLEDGLPGPKRVLTTPRIYGPALASHCEALGLPVIVNRDIGSAKRSVPDDAPYGGHVLRTSGTTGYQKKILMDPAFEAEYHAARRDLLGFTSDTVHHLFNFPPWTGAGYKVPVEVWGCGGTVVGHPTLPPQDALRSCRGTHAALVPMTLARLLALPDGAYAYNPDLELSIGGGAVTWREIEEAKRRIGPRIYNRLSSTETSVIANTLLERPGDQKAHRVLSSRKVEIVDDDGRPLDMGEIGRLRVDTALGPKSYLNHPDETREFFRDGYFYTGDLASIRSDGRLLLHGRVNDVLNVRGHKVSTSILEERLTVALPVSGACILSVEGSGGEEQIVIALESGSPVDPQLVATTLVDGLPRGSRITVVHYDRLPRTETGKISRTALRSRIDQDRAGKTA
jgi:acyl-coenzyme A synthetase/AMP-(fatty) acid ligase